MDEYIYVCKHCQATYEKLPIACLGYDHFSDCCVESPYCHKCKESVFYRRSKFDDDLINALRKQPTPKIILNEIKDLISKEKVFFMVSNHITKRKFSLYPSRRIFSILSDMIKKYNSEGI